MTRFYLLGLNAMFLLIIISLVLLLRNSDFFKRGFRKLVIILFPILCVYACSLGNENGSSPKEALYNYYYGIKEMNLARFKKVVYGEREEQMRLALALYYNSVDFNVEWVKDSFITKDTVVVFFIKANSEWGRTIHAKQFVKRDNHWTCKLMDK